MFEVQAAKAFVLGQLSYCEVVHLWEYQVLLMLFEEREGQGW